MGVVFFVVSAMCCSMCTSTSMHDKDPSAAGNMRCWYMPRQNHLPVNAPFSPPPTPANTLTCDAAAPAAEPALARVLQAQQRHHIRRIVVVGLRRCCGVQPRQRVGGVVANVLRWDNKNNNKTNTKKQNNNKGQQACLEGSDMSAQNETCTCVCSPQHYWHRTHSGSWPLCCTGLSRQDENTNHCTLQLPWHREVHQAVFQ